MGMGSSGVPAGREVIDAAASGYKAAVGGQGGGCGCGVSCGAVTRMLMTRMTAGVKFAEPFKCFLNPFSF